MEGEDMPGQEQLNALMGMFQESQSSILQLVQSLQKQVVALKNEILDQQKAYSDLEKENLDLKSEILVHRTAFSDLEQENLNLQSKNLEQEENHDKTKAEANRNAFVARDFQNKYRRYREENLSLRTALLEMSSNSSQPTQSSTSQASGNDITHRAREQVHTIEDERVDRVERRTSKLSTNKNKKKVRYQEVPTEQKTSPGSSLISPKISPRAGQDGASGTTSLSSARESAERDGVKVHASAARVGNHHASSGRRIVKSDPELARIPGADDVFVPETEMLMGDSESSDDDNYDTCDQYPPNNMRTGGEQKVVRTSNFSKKKQLKRQLKPLVIPETVPTDSYDLSPIRQEHPQGEFFIGQVKQEDQSTLDEFLPLEQSTPMLNGPSDSMLRKAALRRSASSPVLSNVRLSNQSKIPPSESQLLVDFSTTQMSPTFSGGETRLTPGKGGTPGQSEEGVASTPDVTKQSTKHGSMRTTLNRDLNEASGSGTQSASRTHEAHRSGTTVLSKASALVVKTPDRSTDFRKSSSTTPGYDESGQSENSFFLLQQPSNPRTSTTSQTASVGSGGSVTASVSRKRSPGDDQKPGQKRSLPLEEGDDRRAVTKKRRSDEAVHEHPSRNPIDNESQTRRSGRKKATSNPHQVEKPSTLEGDISRHRDERDLADGAKVSSSRGRSLVQSKLSKDSFNPVASSEGQRLKDLNGGRRVHVDSQEDPYIQQAIQESMLMAKLGEQANAMGGGFKMPTVPRGHQRSNKQGLDTIGTKCNDKDTSRHGHKMDKPTTHYRHEGRDLEMVEVALNGSIDPAIDLSLLGDDDNDNIIKDPTAFGNQPQKRNGLLASPDRKLVSLSLRSKICGLIPCKKAPVAAELILLDEDVIERDNAPGREDEEKEIEQPTFDNDSLGDMFDGEDEDDGTKDDRIDDDIGRRDEVKASHAEEEHEEEKNQELLQDDEMQKHEEETDNTFARNFDCLPQKGEAPGYKFKDVVRKRDERQKLKGFDCKECQAYYGGLGLTDEEMALRTKNCSRHRGHYSPPNTPEHYWSIDFPDTPTCLQRGYIQEAVEEEAPRRKRRNPYRHNFTKKKDEEVVS